MSATIQLIQISVEELQDTILNGVKIQLDELKKDFQPKEPTEFLTRKETAELLKINLSTLHNFVKTKKLISYQLGRKIYFKRNEVENSIIELQK